MVCRNARYAVRPMSRSSNTALSVVCRLFMKLMPAVLPVGSARFELREAFSERHEEPVTTRGSSEGAL